MHNSLKSMIEREGYNACRYQNAGKHDCPYNSREAALWWHKGRERARSQGWGGCGGFYG